MTFLGPHAICGRNCRYFHPAPKCFPATVHGDPLHTAYFLAQVMWHRVAPPFLTDNLWVGISFDGTKLWQASFVHFAVGDLGSHMPFGSWILLRGSEKKAIISQLAEVYDLNADLIEVAQQQIPVKGGYLRKVIPFFYSRHQGAGHFGGSLLVHGQKPRSRCLLAVWEKSGNHPPRIGLRDGGDCRGVALGRDDMPDRAPPDYGLHGVHRQVHHGLSALVNSLHTVHR